MTASGPLVSVLLPVRDGAGALGPAVRSVLSGSFADLELVAVDDGSSDASHAELLEIGRTDPRLRVLRQPPSGIVAALNRGLAAARGRLIARQDADNLSRPERLRRQLELLAKRPDLDAVGCGIVFEAPGGVSAGLERYASWQNALVEPEEIRAALFVECPVTHATLLIRREALERAGGWRDRGWPEDYDLIFRLVESGARLGKVAAPLYRWLDREQRLTRQASVYSAEAFHRVRRHFLARLLLTRPHRLDLWGVGKLLRCWAANLRNDGHDVREAELNPKRLQRSRGGRVVIDASELPERTGELLLIAYGMPRSRELVGGALRQQGLRETRDFWCIG